MIPSRSSIMWVLDNILRGLFIMMRITLFGYSLIFVFLKIRDYFRHYNDK